MRSCRFSRSRCVDGYWEFDEIDSARVMDLRDLLVPLVTCLANGNEANDVSSPRKE